MEKSIINRSFSESHLNKEQNNGSFIKRTIYMEEVIQVPNLTTRRLSWGHRLRGNADILPLNSVQKYRSSVVCGYTEDVDRINLDTLNLNPTYGQQVIDSSNNQSVYDHDVTAMEVDTSFKRESEVSTENMDVEMESNCYLEDNIEMKDNSLLNSPEDITKLTPAKHHKAKNMCSNLGSIGVMVLILGILCAYFIDFHSIENREMQFDRLKSHLLSVHGQESVVNSLLESLQYHNHRIKLLGFVGSSGVGKTFVANIVKAHFPKEHTYEYYGLTFAGQESLQKLPNILCTKLNLIIVDDLKVEGFTQFNKLMNILPHDCSIIVLAIFNLQSSTDINVGSNYLDTNLVTDLFSKFHVHNKIFMFQHFDESHVRDWLQNHLEKLKVDRTFYDGIKERVLEGHDIKYSGLKGLFNKMLLEIEKVNRTVF